MDVVWSSSRLRSSNQNPSNSALLSYILVCSIIAAILTPEKHALLTSTVSWATVLILCHLRKPQQDGSAPEKGAFGVVSVMDKRTRRKATILVFCILLSTMCGVVVRDGSVYNSAWWSKAGLPPIVYYLRNHLIGEPGILEPGIRNNRRTMMIVTGLAGITLLPSVMSSAAFTLGICNAIFSSLVLVLFEDIAGSLAAAKSGGLSNVAAICTLGFTIATIFFETKLWDGPHHGSNGLRNMALQIGVAGIAGGIRWSLVPSWASTYSATSVGFVDLASVLVAGICVALPSLGQVFGTLLSLAGIVPLYIPLPTIWNKDIFPQRIRPSRSIIAIVLIFMIVSSLFIVRSPQASGSSPVVSLSTHPIKLLIEQASNHHDELVKRQSKTLSEAVRNYKKRYNMDPPPNFDKWYQFAVSKKSVLIDEYDTIYHSLLPFWGLPPKIIRDRAREAIGYRQSLILVSLRNGEVMDIRDGFEWQRNATLEMLESFRQYLPDMDLAFNMHDEPRVITPFEELSAHVRKAQSFQAPASAVNYFTGFPTAEQGMVPENEDSYFNVFDRQKTWAISRISCAFDTPARDPLELAADATDNFAQQPLGFVKNRTAQTDVCLQPSLRERHGFFQRPNAFNVVHSLVPIFSQSKVSSYNDIIYPSPWYWADKVKYNYTSDRPWNQKANALYWRGGTTGGYSRQGGWKKQHRQRFVNMTNHREEMCSVLQRKNILKKDSPWKVVERHQGVHSHLFNVTFSDVGNCDLEDCSAQTGYFHVTMKWVDFAEAYKNKYVFDIDGFAFSGRFYALLRSNSAVFKQAMFREWHEDWLVPWVHYVPLSMEMKEVVEVMRYFNDEMDGRRAIEKIAEEGKRWAGSVLRKDDFQVWFFRLLLEYGRVIDDNREKIGYVGKG